MSLEASLRLDIDPFINALGHHRAGSSTATRRQRPVAQRTWQTRLLCSPPGLTAGAHRGLRVLLAASSYDAP